MTSRNRTKEKYELVRVGEPNEFDSAYNEKKFAPLARIDSLSPVAEEPKREKWANTIEFFLSCIGYAVGLGNIWRFPYLCYNNGGGAFLLPYCISLILCGVPMFVLETSWGQLLSIGGLGIWRLCPILKGVGIAAVVVAFWLNIYYIIVLAWAIYYFYHSFTMPWSSCKNVWNTVRCRSEYDKCSNLSALIASGNLTLDQLQFREHTDVYTSDSVFNSSYKFCEIVSNYSSPVREFWERQALSVTDHIEKTGDLRWDLALCLLIAWILCYLAIFKGVGWTGKVVYFTAVFPYVLLVILFFRGITLPGAGKGLAYYIYPQMDLLTDAEVWKKAFTQIFFTYGLALGALVALGSYNKYHNNIVKQAFSICLIDSGTSIFAGFAVFSFIGYMSEMQDQKVEDVAKAGPGLLFIVYPSGIMSLDWAGFWSVLFFFMVILIGIDSQFCTMEGFYTAIIDEWPKYLRKSPNREIFIAIFSGISFLIGLSMVTEGGIWVFQLLDDYGASSWCLLWLLFFECIAISWLYGVNKWYVHLEDMVGYRPSVWWKFCWVVACPLCCAGIFVFSLIDYEGTKYNGVSVPPWADGVGWLIALSSMLCIPVYAVWLWIKTPGSFHQMSDVVAANGQEEQNDHVTPYQIYVSIHEMAAQSLNTTSFTLDQICENLTKNDKSLTNLDDKALRSEIKRLLLVGLVSGWCRFTKKGGYSATSQPPEKVKLDEDKGQHQREADPGNPNQVPRNVIVHGSISDPDKVPGFVVEIDDFIAFMEKIGVWPKGSCSTTSGS